MTVRSFLAFFLQTCLATASGCASHSPAAADDQPDLVRPKFYRGSCAGYTTPQHLFFSLSPSFPMSNILRSFFLLTLLLAGCGQKETVAPAATASFTLPLPVAEVGEVVTLTNTSQHATRYEWRSSDSATLVNTATSPTLTFTQPGTYSITLTAFNAAGQSTSATQTLKVGRRYLKEVRVNNLSFTNAAGSPWDGNSGPDVKWTLAYQTTRKATGATVADMTQAMLPLSWNTVPLNLETAHAGWTLTFWETNNLLGDDQMLNLTLDESVPPTNRDAAGTGTKSYTDKAWNVVLTYETR